MSDREDIQNLKEAVEAIKNGLGILWALHEADKAELEKTIQHGMARSRGFAASPNSFRLIGRFDQNSITS